MIGELTSIVKKTERFRRVESEGKLVRIPTGDGMALVSSMIRRQQLNAQWKSRRPSNLIPKFGYEWEFTAAR